MKRMDLKSGILPTLAWYCDTGMRKRYHVSGLVIPLGGVTCTVLLSVMKFVPTIMFGDNFTRY